MLCLVVNAAGHRLTQQCSRRQKPAHRSRVPFWCSRECFTGCNTYHHCNRVGRASTQGWSIIPAWDRIFSGVCLSVCLFIHMLSQKLLRLRSSNLTEKCFTVSLGNPFILGSDGERWRSWVTKNSASVGLCTAVSAGFFWLNYAIVQLTSSCLVTKHIVFAGWSGRRWIAENSQRFVGCQTLWQEGLLVPANRFVA